MSDLLKSFLSKRRSIADKATPGPWQSCNGFQGFGLIEGVSKQHKVDVVVDDGTYDSQYTGVLKRDDGAFIADARNCIPLQLQMLEILYDALAEIAKPIPDEEFPPSDAPEWTDEELSDLYMKHRRQNRKSAQDAIAAVEALLKERT